MKKVYLRALVDTDKCIGDRICENMCPSGAIVMIDKKAQVDESKCVACFRCSEVCGEDAIRYVPLDEPRILGVDPAQVDQDRLRELCRRAHLDPDETICMCTLMPAKEVAAAILLGAKTPEEVVLMTGVRSGCALYCISPVLRLLRASGADMSPPAGYNWYPSAVSLWDVTDEVARKYPQYRFEEDLKVYSDTGGIDSMLSRLKGGSNAK